MTLNFALPPDSRSRGLPPTAWSKVESALRGVRPAALRSLGLSPCDARRRCDGHSMTVEAATKSRVASALGKRASQPACPLNVRCVSDFTYLWAGTGASPRVVTPTSVVGQSGSGGSTQTDPLPDVSSRRVVGSLLRFACSAPRHLRRPRPRPLSGCPRRPALDPGATARPARTAFQVGKFPEADTLRCTLELPRPVQ